MSTSTNNSSSYIETVKKTNSGETTQTPDYKTFTVNIIYIVIGLFISIIVSSGFIYLCKVAQANVLVDSLKYSPFTDLEKNPEPILVDVNIIKEYDGFFGKFGLGFGEPKQTYSTKVIFDNLNTIFKFFSSWKKKLEDNIDIKKFKEIKNDSGEKTITNEELPNTGFDYISLFFYKVLGSSITQNFYIYNYLFNFLNSMFSESILLILFYFSSSMLLPVTFLLNMAIIFYNVIVNLVYIWYSRWPQNNDKTGENPSVWKYDANNAFNGFLMIGTIRNVVFITLLCFLFPIIFCLSVYTFFQNIYFCLNNKGKIVTTSKNGTNEPSKKIFDFFYFIKSIFHYESQVIIMLFVYNLFSNVINNLGNNYASPFILAVVLILIFTSVFKSYIYNKDTDTTLTEGMNMQPKQAKVISEIILQEPSIQKTPNINQTNKQSTPPIETSNVSQQKTPTDNQTIKQPTPPPINQTIKQPTPINETSNVSQQKTPNVNQTIKQPTPPPINQTIKQPTPINEISNVSQQKTPPIKQTIKQPTPTNETPNVSQQQVTNNEIPIQNKQLGGRNIKNLKDYKNMK
jgi:hypothetical protein